MEEKILEQCLLGMETYVKAKNQIDLGLAADKMADSLEEIMRILSKNKPKYALQNMLYKKK